MLMGEYMHTIDAKGRVILPVDFRPEFGASFVITKGLDNCLFLAIQGSLGLSTLYWAAQALAQMPLPTVRSINTQLVKRLAKRTAIKGGALALGRLIP